MFKRHQISTPITKNAATRQNAAESHSTLAKTSAVFFLRNYQFDSLPGFRFQ